jgi:iron(III) transport system substrate-binding protein
LALTQDEIANLSGPDRQTILEDGARKEGEVSFFSTMFLDRVLQPMAADFQKKYPFIEMKVTRSESAEILQRVLAEVRARSLRTDVVDGELAEPLKAAGLAASFTSRMFAEYPENYIAPDRSWASGSLSWYGLAWNTKLVSPADAPKDWEDLVDPKWKGRLVWAESSSTGAPRLITHLRKIWGEEKALDFLTKLKAQNIRTLPGSIRTVLDQVIAGEAAIGVNMAMHHIGTSKTMGAPIAGLAPEPVLTRPQTVNLLKGAPHPYAAMLFMDYFLSKDGGQKVVRDAGYNPANPAVEPLAVVGWFQPTKEGKKQLVMLPEEVEAYRAKSQDLYKTMFR